MPEQASPPTPFRDRNDPRWKLRRLWRSRIRPAWREVRGIVILGAAIAVIILGTYGYMQPKGGDFDFLDALYKAFQLFGFGGGDTPDKAPIALNVARFVAPVLVGYAAVRGLMALSRDQLQLIGLRIFRRGHVVIAGLGDVGFRLATSLSDDGGPVIVIDSDPTNANFEGCRERGISALAGDASDERVLDAARVGRARHLVIACGSDAVNVDVAAAARRLAASRSSGTLTAFAHIEELGLWQALEARALTEPPEPTFRLDLINIYEVALRLMLERYPPFLPGHQETALSVLVAADDSSGEILVLNIARIWHSINASPAGRPRITLAGPDAERERERLLDKYAQLGEICELDAWGIELSAPSIAADPRVAAASAIYVALSDEARGVTAALMLARGMRNTDRVVLAINDEARGAARVVSGDDQGAGKIAVFGVLSRTLRPDLLFRGLNETMARAMHDSYLRSQLAAGSKPGESPALVPWSELPESLKESNRRYADGIGPKLRAIDCIAVPTPLVVSEDAVRKFSDAEVELLAQLEHDRWVRDLSRDRYIPGKVIDHDRKTHTALVPWSQLNETEREKDRVAVRDLPDLLTDAGFELRRVPTG